MLVQSVSDPYEFIRRKSTFSMGRIGKDMFIPYIASVYVNDFLDERVQFNSTFCFDLMNIDKLEAEVVRQINESDWLMDKQAALSKFKGVIDSKRRMAEYSLELADKTLKPRARLMGVSMLRNNPYHQLVDQYLKVLADNSESVELRTSLAEALGWFTLSYRKGDIISTCRSVASEANLDPALRAELLKTANRLEVYMR